MVPFVVEKDRSYDIYSRLLKDRIIFLSEDITKESAANIIAQMLFLNIEDKEKDISFYIMSNGGEINASFAILDTIKFITNDVATYCIGEASSGAALLLSGGTKGKRFALPSARIMLHQPSGGIVGTADEISNHTQEMERLRLMLNAKLAKITGKTIAQINTDLKRDFFMSATEAQKYGLIDKCLT